ncbi:CD44 antigen isoform X2 [Bufo bufo]|uniref:CD44 antigen isoform X2 n=1 Tax=Bufo bufo TaxID=8384 RepID=UPI001ABE0255|nr:CD44 antigen isoform X2 [Bufo bufo]
MAKPLWIFCFGLFSWISISQSQIIISCRFQGVFHVEKVARYSLGFEEAKKTCSELDAIIATKDQVEIAHEVGFETCRYGWVENGSVVIPRITGNPICAAGYIGVYVLHTNATTLYDVYCYNTSETSEKTCEQYDYHNKSLPSYDPTEEGDIHHSPSSEVSPTHPGQDISSSLTEQGGLVEDRTIHPLMSTEFPEHSGDHLGTKEDEGGIKSPNLGPNEIDQTNEYDGFIEVMMTTDDDFLAGSEDNRPATDPTIQRETGSFNDGKPLEDDKDGNIEMTPEPDSTEYDPKSPFGGPTEGSSDSSKNKHRRKAAVPEWLIVCVSLVCLGLIFSVCIAINARRLCGQKKKLVINGNKASPEDGVIMEHNGDTVKSQEMVQLVSRDQTGDFGEGDGLSQDNMRNAKDTNMKIGV